MAEFLMAQVPRDGSVLSFPTSPFLVAVRTLALEGKAPDVARFLPVTGGRRPESEEELAAEAAAYARMTLEHKAEIADVMRRGVQSNPVSEERAVLRSYVAAAGQAATVDQPLYYAKYTTCTLKAPNTKHRLELSSWNGQGHRRIRTTAPFNRDVLNLGHFITKAQRMPHR